MEERLKTAEEVFGKKIDFYEASARGNVRDRALSTVASRAFGRRLHFILGSSPPSPTA